MRACARCVQVGVTTCPDPSTFALSCDEGGFTYSCTATPTQGSDSWTSSASAVNSLFAPILALLF
jgi:hypothetical protein